MRTILLALITSLLLVALAISQRHWIMIQSISSGAPPPLLEASQEPPNVRWFDDYFTVTEIPGPTGVVTTWAIGEPRYAQLNYSYLIAGTERAVLFDAGPGHRDLRPVVASLTDLPVTFIPSHFHYDHVGNTVTFENVAVVDLPHVRRRADDNHLTLTWEEHLGTAEGVDAPTLNVDQWLAPGEVLPLGNRYLRVLYTPGHTDDSISLLDSEQKLLFSGDYLYPGELYAFLPNSNLGDYRQATDLVMAVTPPETVLLGAHRGRGGDLPRLSLADVQAVQGVLEAIESEQLAPEGFYPQVYPINDNLLLMSEPPWLQRWEARYPEFGVDAPEP